jgi:hypothetical protein
MIMNAEADKIKDGLVAIATETFRFQRVFEKAISKLDIDEKNKYMSQYMWFSKRVGKTLDDVGIRVVSLEGQMYDPGMSVTPLNIDDFAVEDSLYIVQMIEPIIMQDDMVKKMGTVILGRVE